MNQSDVITTNTKDKKNDITISVNKKDILKRRSHILVSIQKWGHNKNNYALLELLLFVVAESFADLPQQLQQHPPQQKQDPARVPLVVLPNSSTDFLIKT
jgi:hypothetical protein